MNINRRRLLSFSKKELIFHQQRFYPSGTYYWTVPEGCTQVDVFLVGGGGGAENGGAGGGYTKTYKSSSDGYKDGNAIPVTPGETIEIIVGKGGEGIYNEDTNYGPSLTGNPGGYSQFKNSLYRVEGGRTGSGGYLTGNYGGDGGSGGGSYYHGGSDGEDGGTTWVVAKDGYSGKNWTASWTGGSWAHLNNSGASITAANGSTLQINCNANTSTSSRSGSCKIGIVGHPVQEACRIDVTQSGATQQSFGFTFNISNPVTYTAYAISTSSISSISGTFRGMFLNSVGTLPSNVTTVINSSNGTSTTNAFSGAGQSKSFKLWAVPTSGDSGSLILKATFTVSEGGSYTYTGSW